jgi:transcriptional regulator with XRE-family HTH domain
MGKTVKGKPKRLAEKMLKIRHALGLSQNGMIRRLGLSDVLLQASISGYELGTRVPPLHVVLLYAEAAGISTDVLLDDRLDLPAVLPSRSSHAR